MNYPLTEMDLLKKQEKGIYIPKNTEAQKELGENIGYLVDAINKQNALLQANNEMLAQILEGQQKTAVRGEEQGMQTIGKSKSEKAFCAMDLLKKQEKGEWSPFD